MVTPLSQDAQKCVNQFKGLSRQDQASVVAALAREAVQAALSVGPSTVGEMANVLDSFLKRATTSSRITSIEGHQAIVGVITVNGEQFETLLSECSFGKSREQKRLYAERLGFRIAKREENRAYVEALLDREDKGATNDAEIAALTTYRERLVRDIHGCVKIDGSTVKPQGLEWYDGGDVGALFVRPFAESN